MGIVPASDTGAVELALWNFISDARGLMFCLSIIRHVGAGWPAASSIKNLTLHEAVYGQLPDLSQINFDRDVVLTWNATTAGTCLPDGISSHPIARA